MTRDLPEFPNLDYLKKRAKLLLRELQQNKPEAKLAEAQFTLAREYGFASWAKLKEQIESMSRSSGGGTGGAAAVGDTGPSGPGQFARYTDAARRTIFFARFWAARRESPSIETEHLLLGLIEADSNLINRMLHDHSACETIREAIERRSVVREKVSAFQTPLSNASKQILQRAAVEADRLRHKRISTGHFLLGFMHDEGSLAASVLSGILADKRMSPEKAEEYIAGMLNEESV